MSLFLVLKVMLSAVELECLLQPASFRYFKIGLAPLSFVLVVIVWYNICATWNTKVQNTVPVRFEKFCLDLFICNMTLKLIFLLVVILKVVACSFVYGASAKSNNNNNKTIKQEIKPKEEPTNSEMETTPGSAPEAAASTGQHTPQNFPAQGMSGWPGSGSGSGSGRSLDSSRNPLTDIDLTRG